MIESRKEMNRIAGSASITILGVLLDLPEHYLINFGLGQQKSCQANVKTLKHGLMLAFASPAEAGARANDSTVRHLSQCIDIPLRTFNLSRVTSLWGTLRLPRYPLFHGFAGCTLGNNNPHVTGACC